MSGTRVFRPNEPKTWGQTWLILDKPVLSLAWSESEGNALTGYTVFIDDNFHYQDQSERIIHGVFATADEALAACRSIVDNFLADAFEPGMSSTALYECYVGFGDDPFMVPVQQSGAPVSFSAWDYARERCEAMAART
jgi:hypothetical protein